MPLGGMVQSDQSVGSIDLEGTRYASEIFTPAAAATLYVAGTVLGRITATGKLLPSLIGAADGSQVPVGLLGHDVLSDGTPSDENVRMVIFGGVIKSKLQYLPAARGTLTGVQLDSLRLYGIWAGVDLQNLKFDNS